MESSVLYLTDLSGTNSAGAEEASAQLLTAGARQRVFYPGGRLIIFDGDSLQFYLGPSATPEPSLAYHELPPRHLRHALINVADACNLNCKYCFAGGGSYGRAPSLMTGDTVHRIAEALSRYDHIAAITFYGGEPTLNFAAIRTFVELLSPTVGVFALITNGVEIDAADVAYLAVHRFHVTVSIDGPREIHDALRGEYDRTATTIADLAARPRIQLRLSARFTPTHVEFGFTRDLISDFFRSTFPGVPYFIGGLLDCGRVGGGSAVANHRDCGEEVGGVERTFRSLCSATAASDPEKSVVRLLSALVLRDGSPHFCRKCEDRDTLNFDIDGATSPCHRRFGGADHEDFIRARNDKRRVEGCAHCWAWLLCNRCPASSEDLAMPDPESCPIAQRIASVIEHLLAVRCDEYRYRMFARNLARAIRDLQLIDGGEP